MRTDRGVFVLAGLPVGRPFAPLGCYQISRRSDIGVLPEAQNGPTEVVEMLVGLPVALDVAGQLGRPPFLVRHGVCRVRGAPVPEATVNEDRDMRPGEEEVCAATRKARDRVVDAEPEPATVQLPAEEELRFGVPATLPGHASRHVG